MGSWTAHASLALTHGRTSCSLGATSVLHSHTTPHKSTAMADDKDSGAEDGIYIFEDDSDSQTLLDLQLELALVKKKLKVTEMAYRALEDEFVSLKASNNIVLILADDSVCLPGLPNAPLSEHDAGRQAAQRMIEGVRQNLVAQGEPADAQVVLLVVTSDASSRDFLHGFSSNKDTFVVKEHGCVDKLKDLMNLFLPMPQLRWVYLSLTPEATGKVLLPHIMTAIDHMYCTSEHQHNNHSPNPSSPTLRRRRSWTSASSLSNLSKAPANDGLLAKIVLYQTDDETKQALTVTRNAVILSCTDREHILREVLETDFDSLFARVELPRPDDQNGHITPDTAEKERGLAVAKAEQSGPEADMRQQMVIADSAASEVEAIRSSDKIAKAVIPPPNPAPSPPASAPEPASTPSKWTEIVRKGKPAAVSPETKTSALPLGHSASVSPGSHKKQDGLASHVKGANSNGKPGKTGGTPSPTELDPSVSLCRQKKPPCNQFYLTKRGCLNPKCNYSHTYRLNDKQIEELRSGALRTACVYKKSNNPCLGGDDCVFGHKCPQGSKCKQGSRCHFPEHMH